MESPASSYEDAGLPSKFSTLRSDCHIAARDLTSGAATVAESDGELVRVAAYAISRIYSEVDCGFAHYACVKTALAMPAEIEIVFS